MNSVSILFSWYKNFGGVIKRREETLVMGETNSELERTFFTDISI